MIDFKRKAHYTFEDVMTLIHLLRSPGGCPWDQAQSHDSIRRNFLEETYEACEAIDRDDPAALCEELGDVLTQVVFHTDIEHDAGRFSMEDVCSSICTKMIRRHPQLFSQEEGAGLSWDQLKQLEKGQTTQTQALESVAKSLPALWRAEKLQSKGEKSGLLTAEPQQVLAWLQDAAASLASAVQEGRPAQDALGQVLFAAVWAARLIKTDPEAAAHAACETFTGCFSKIETTAEAGSGEAASLPDLIRLWSTL